MTQITTTTYGNGIVWTPQVSERNDTPKGLLVTRAVEVKDGWVGQIIVDKAIVWQGAEMEKQCDAVEQATEKVVVRLRKLFAS
jgi:hypothetical protein